MHHLERYTSPEWPVHAHNRRSAPHALSHERVPKTLCIQNVLAAAPQTAGATLRRAADLSRIKMHHFEPYAGLEWRAARTHSTAVALHTRA